MPDATPAPDPRPAIRAGGTLDFSTGPPAPPPPPPAPLPPAPDDPTVRAGKTLNLSTGRAPSGPPRKPSVAAVLGSGPVIRETLDLSSTTPRPAPEAPAPARDEPARRDSNRGGRARDPRTGGGPPRGGSKRRDDSRRPDDGGGRPSPGGGASASESLADLLDPAVLAKLRGG